MGITVTPKDAARLLKGRVSSEELQSLLASTKRSHKYRACPTVIDGRRFDSQGEARRYSDLCWLLRAGTITELDCQYVFPLYVLQVETGELIRIGEYRADFRYVVVATGAVVIEDYKNEHTRTSTYRLKKRHVEAQYGVQIREVG